MDKILGHKHLYGMYIYRQYYFSTSVLSYHPVITVLIYQLSWTINATKTQIIVHEIGNEYTKVDKRAKKEIKYYWHQTFCTDVSYILLQLLTRE